MATLDGAGTAHMSEGGQPSVSEWVFGLFGCSTEDARIHARDVVLAANARQWLEANREQLTELRNQEEKENQRKQDAEEALYQRSLSPISRRERQEEVAHSKRLREQIREAVAGRQVREAYEREPHSPPDSPKACPPPTLPICHGTLRHRPRKVAN